MNTENPDEALDRLDQYCGEAYFARALAYSELIKLFCKSYESDEEAANELGVVLTLHYKGDEPMKRASEDSYALVLSDLDKAADLLKLEEDYNPTTRWRPFNTTYFNEYTVHALRARVALYMRKWDDAIKYASKVIDSNYYVLSSVNQYVSNGVNYYQYMWTSDNSTEAIWKVGFTSLVRRSLGNRVQQLRLRFVQARLCSGKLGVRPLCEYRPACSSYLQDHAHRLQPRIAMAVTHQVLR